MKLSLVKKIDFPADVSQIDKWVNGKYIYSHNYLGSEGRWYFARTHNVGAQDFNYPNLDFNITNNFMSSNSFNFISDKTTDSYTILLVKEFDTYFSFQDNISRVYLDGLGSLNGTPVGDIIFINTNDECVLTSRYYPDDYNYRNIVCSVNNASTGLFNSFEYLDDGQFNQFVDSVRTLQLNDTNLHTNVTIKAVVVGVGNRFDDLSGINNMSIDNIAFNNVINGTNEMPEFNFTISTDECVNNTIEIDTIPINLEVDIFDEENDTIYYSIDSESKNVYTVGEFFNNDFGEVTANDDSCIFNPTITGVNFIPLNLIKYINWTISCSYLTSSASKVNIYVPATQLTQPNDRCQIGESQGSLHLEPFFDINGKIREMMRLDQQCDGKPEMILQLSEQILGNLDNGYFKADIYFKGNINNTFNVTLYKFISPEEKLIEIVFLYNETDKLQVFNSNSSGLSHLGTINLTNSVTDYNDYQLDFMIQYNNINKEFNVSGVGLFEEDVFTSKQLTPFNTFGGVISYVGISVPGDNSTFANDYVLYNAYGYGGNVLNPIFSPIIPTEINVTGSGTFPVTLYITDDFHLNTNYTFKTELLTVSRCSEYIDGIGSEDIKGTGKILKPALSNACLALDNALTITDENNKTFNPSRYGFCFWFKAVYLIFFGFFAFGLAWVISLLKRSLFLPLGLIFFGMTFASATIFFEFNIVTKLVMSLLTVIGFVWIIRLLFSEDIGTHAQGN